MSTAVELLATEFATRPELIRANARDLPDKVAVADEGGRVSYAELDRLMDPVAAGLQRDGTAQRQAVVAPIQSSATPAQIVGMVANSGATLVFLDSADAVAGLDSGYHGHNEATRAADWRDDTSAGTVLAETNARLGKTQRLSTLHAVRELSRSAVGKVLKRELRDRVAAGEFVAAQETA